jgi:2-iminobutanoate/2-iminopropanoate deaminase
VLDAAGQHVPLHWAELVCGSSDHERLHPAEHDSELLVRMTVERYLGSGFEIDQVEHRTRAEERPARHARSELERLHVLEADELRLHGRPIMLDSVADREEIRVTGLAEPISHYTDAVRVGDLLFVSGVVPVDAGGRLVGGDDVVEQARQVFRTIGEVLAAAGASFQDVAKVTVFLTDVDDRAAINPVRQEVFGDSRPASTLVEISRLAIPGAKIEVECVAALPGDGA